MEIVKIQLNREEFNKLTKAVGLPDAKSVHFPNQNITFYPPIEVVYALKLNDQSLRVEQWPEGHVVWANGKIIWKSWETLN